MRRAAERPLAAIDECRAHAVRFRPDAVEGVIGDEQDAGALLADDLGRLGIGLPMRLEISGFLNRDDMIEAKTDMRPRSLEHVAVAIRKDRKLVAFGPQLLERRNDVGKWLEPLDLRHQGTHLVVAVGDTAAVHHMRYGPMPDLAVRRMPAVAQRIDHRALEMGAPPPGDEAAGLAMPALPLQKRRDRLDQPPLHIDDGAVLIERQRLDLALEDFRVLHVESA